MKNFDIRPQFVILDRDGVINHDSADYIKNEQEWRAIPESLEAMARLSKENIPVAVVTNQSGIGRGYYTHDTLEKMHNKMTEQLAAFGGKIKQIEYCPHLPDDDCICRKPRPEMLLRVLKQNQWDENLGIFVGDSISDKLAADACGINFFLVKTGKGNITLCKYPGEIKQNQIYENLARLVDALLNSN